MPDQNQISKAAEKLKKKLKEEKVSLKDYSLSGNKESTKTENSPQKKRHQIKEHKITIYLSNEAMESLNSVYITRYMEDKNVTKKISKSTLICEAIDLLAAKQAKRRQEN